VHAVVGDFEHHLGAIPRSGRRLVAFLGSTIGNFPPAQRKEFLASLAATMSPGDSLLLGTDLVKDVARLEAAYADRRGVTAEFNLNVLAVVNRELAADFDLARFEHRSFFDVDEERIEMRLRSTADQVVTVGELGLELEFAEGDEIRTELSHKFRRQGVADELAGAGLELAGWWTDPAEDFALSLAVAR
jgi:L-histidine N-alpha-methyltransferase